MGTIHPRPNKRGHRDRGRGNSALPKSPTGEYVGRQGGRIVAGSGSGPKGHGVVGVTHYWVEGTGWVGINLKNGKRK